jgi:cytidine deaminase
MSESEELMAAAEAVRDHAYAPYSRFAVGAAVRDEAGRIHIGANVENVAYPEGICAEAAALAAMVAAGGRRITAVAVAVSGQEPAPPCGGCRQKLAEFAVPETPIHLAAAGGGRCLSSLGELFPHGFARRHLPG